ncbi:MAG: hypothetical protein AB7G75_02765 [Candidatus Binatia bacterium]
MTRTTVNAAPALVATKAVSLFADSDGTGTISAGDTFLYSIPLRNLGNSGATGITFSDTPDVNTNLVPGSVHASLDMVTGGNAGLPPVTVDIGSLPGNGGPVVITYQVTVQNPLPAGVTQLNNQGSVSSNELAPVPKMTQRRQPRVMRLL